MAVLAVRCNADSPVDISAYSLDNRIMVGRYLIPRMLFLLASSIVATALVVAILPYCESQALRVKLTFLLGGSLSSMPLAAGAYLGCADVPRIWRLGWLIVTWLTIASLLSVVTPTDARLWVFAVGAWNTVGLSIGLMGRAIWQPSPIDTNWQFSIADMLIWMVLLALVLGVGEVPRDGNLVSGLIWMVAVASVDAALVAALVTLPRTWIGLAVGMVFCYAANLVAIDIRSEALPWGHFITSQFLWLYLACRWALPLPWTYSEAREAACRDPDDDSPP